jgi:hypothetical protein
MIHNSIPAAFGVNRYLWSKLTGAVLDPANYGGLTPIIPTQEEPTFLQAMEKQPGIGAFPYIVYTYSTQGISPQYWEVNDQIVYMIAAHDQKKLRELMLTIVGLLKRFDDSAAEINAYIQSATKPDPDNAGQTLPLFSDEYRAYNYKYTSVQGINASLARTDENAPYRAMVTVRVGYTNDFDDSPIADLYQN